jgi:hypothetical protein
VTIGLAKESASLEVLQCQIETHCRADHLEQSTVCTQNFLVPNLKWVGMVKANQFAVQFCERINQIANKR